MKRIYIIIMLTIPVYLNAQAVAPRRPLTLDLEQQPTRKTLLQFREEIKDNQNKEISDNSHELQQVTQQKTGRATEAH